MGIAAAAAVAAGGAFFASQAGAAQPTGHNVMIRTKPYIRCAYVYDYAPNGTLRGRDNITARYDYAALRWNPQTWNSTGIKAQSGDTVQVWLSYDACTRQYVSSGPGKGWVYRVKNGYTVKYHVDNKTNNAWVDTTKLPVLDATWRHQPSTRPQVGAKAGNPPETPRPQVGAKVGNR